MGESHFQAGMEVAGRYRLSERLGEGASAWVWAAEDRAQGRAVALKFMKPDATESRAARRRFRREAQAVAAIAHPNIVVIHDVLELDGGPVLVMNRLFGETLKHRLARETKLDPHTTATILLQVVDGMRAAHASGILHRDLKPDNIFLCSSPNGNGEPSVTVLDFGLAKIATGQQLESLSGELTQSGAMLGTPYYMSPEQVFGERDIDERADVWSLGVVLYQCLSGIRPTEAGNIGQILKRVTHNDIVPLRSVAPHVSPVLADLVMRMLRTDRTERPGLIEVRSVFESITAGKSIRILAVAKGFASGSSSAPSVHLTRPARRSVPVMAAFGLCAGAVAALGLLGAHSANPERAAITGSVRVVEERNAASSPAAASPSDTLQVLTTLGAQPPQSSAAITEKAVALGGPSQGTRQAPLRRNVPSSEAATRRVGSETRAQSKPVADVELFDDPM